ncbi:ATP-binding protein [Desulfobacterales bacterium HSG2]|nr:ATP-binding protein [Desulfobacterales bacterium HSG2]
MKEEILINIRSCFSVRKGKNRLAHRLLLSVVLCSAFFSMLTTGFQLYLEYRRDRAVIQANIHFIRDSYLEPVTISAYMLDEKHTSLQLQGALKLQDIVYLEVIESDEETPWVIEGDPEAGRDILSEFPLIYDNSGDEEEFCFGLLRVVASMDGLYQRLWEKVLIILSSNAVKTFLASFCILLIIQFMVTRHLGSMAEYARQLNLDKLDGHLALDRSSSKFSESDELDQVVSAINDMQLRIRDDIIKFREAEDALRRSHDELELAVERRTRELVETNTKLKEEIEERKRAEAALREKQVQLAHAGRLTSLGEMATGIAHELNQPLFLIRLSAESLKFQLKKAGYPDSQSDGELDSVIKSVDRAANIIDHMRGFARIGPGNQEEISLAEPVENGLTFFRQQFKNHQISLETDYEENLPKVVLDPQRFEQVVVNFLSNARYAVDRRGERESDGYQKKIALRLFYDKEKKGNVFEITDNGIGMTDDEKERCLDPFFTTKEVGEGTGLGMSIAHGIVREFKGKLEIESEKGMGTTMRVII